MKRFALILVALMAIAPRPMSAQQPFGAPRQPTAS